MPAWKVDPIWKGLTAVIVGGGESFSETSMARLIGIARASGKIRVIAINDAVYPCWFADIAYACDGSWWRAHNGVPGFPGVKVRLRVANNLGFDINPAPYPDIEYLDASVNEENVSTGYDPDTSKLRTGGNSGFQALHLAAHLGVSRAILVGFDCRGKHWFGSHPQEINQATQPLQHPKWIQFFADIGKELSARGMTIQNASPGTAIKCFPVVTLHAALKEIGAIR